MRPTKGRPGASRGDPGAAEVAELKARIAAGAPPRGSDAGLPPPAPSQPARSSGPPPPTPLAGRRHFKDLPLSRPTLAGLAAAGYDRMTAIQRTALPHALAGRDVLGAAKTGSGKTLAFLIPALETLFRARWSRLDGLGALILVPTRELAHQVFTELAKVGKYHAFSAGLLIGGGHAVSEEAARLAALHILVATPGRLLQHADESPGWEPASLRVLVLDEADRLLDMGFAPTLDAIVAGLPASRQTLLFSATQAKSVRSLARLALADPERADVHAGSTCPTPLRLRQAWAAVPAPAKADVVWAFLRSHPSARTIIFFATCKQVRFFHAAFCRLRPGVPLRALHGGMKQAARAAAVAAFASAPAGAALLATDVAARGLDFPSVDWVLQADCPDDVEAYIHRAGRTARYVRAGRALLLLTPGEAPGMVKALAAAAIPVTEARLNPGKAAPVSPALAALLSKDAALKAQAQRAVGSYLRSLALQPNKAVFGGDVSAPLPAAAYAASLGLATAPRVAKRADAALAAAARAKAARGGGGGEGEGDGPPSSSEEGEGGEGSEGGAPPTPAPAASTPATHESDDEEEDDLLVVKTANVFSTGPSGAGGEGEGDDATPGATSNQQQKKRKRLRIDPRGGSSAAVAGGRVVFDEDGAALPPLALLGREGGGIGEGGEGSAPQAAPGGRGLDVGPHASAAARLAAARAALASRDKGDRAAYAAERKRARKEKDARARAREAGEEGGEGEEESEEESGGESDRSPPPPSSPPRALLPEPAHKGMARRAAAADAYVPSTLAETEALALSLMRQRG